MVPLVQSPAIFETQTGLNIGLVASLNLADSSITLSDFVIYKRMLLVF